MTDNRNSEQDVPAEMTETQPKMAQPANIFVRLLLTNLICLVVVVTTGWHFIIKPYINSIESQLSETMTATRGVAPMSDVEELRKGIDALQAKVLSLEQHSLLYVDIQRDLQIMEAKLKEVDHKISADVSKTQNIQEWRDDIAKAINAAEPLTSFRENPLIPEKIREMISGIDFIPTYKNISESWAKFRSSIKLQAQPLQKEIVLSESWWDGFKIFLKSIFKIQRLDKDYLTSEEVFIRQVDKILIENDVEALCRWVDLYTNRFDVPTKTLVKDWMDKLRNYQQGQLILNMVKRIK